MTAWTQQQALDRWLEDLDAGDAAAELVRQRLGEGPLDRRDARERAFCDAAARWLERGQPRVALALLDRGTALADRPEAAAGRVDLDVLLAALPGAAGLPALTGVERDAFVAADSPQEALAVLRDARARLEAHGREARGLLRRWLARGRP